MRRLSRTSRSIVGFAFLAVASVGLGASSPIIGFAAEPSTLVPVVYAPPTDAAVADEFRAPATPYGAGNRGLEFATTPGDPIRASASGTVRFSGQVGAASSVTIAHDDGLVTTYSFLEEARVVSGDAVTSGQVVGIATGGFHFGVKRHDVYLDPAVLLAASARSDERRAILVPVSSATDP